MAETKNKIYYPDNYEAVADIPADLKKQAESIDTAISLINNDINENKKESIINDSLKIHWQGVLLEQGEEGNYMEIGEKGQASNKVKFGWNLEAGETLIIEVRGDTNE